MAPNHRLLTIPAALVGAAALVVGLVAGLLSIPLNVLDAWSLAGAGLALMVLCAGVAGLMGGLPAPMVQHRRAPAMGIAAVAIALLLTLGIGAGAILSPVPPAAVDDLATAGLDAAASAEGFLGGESFEGALQGAIVPVLGGVGGTGTTDEVHELAVPNGTGAYRLELEFGGSGPGAASELTMVLEGKDGDAWVELASATGASVLVLDAADLKTEELRLRILLPSGSPSATVSYTAHASAFAGAIPPEFSAIE